ncbi:hypothetical protein HDU85_002965 [Gaertneriomyces sp. JEL0708]|nr:hypothetical protein HDU85_002965 [Gaertneriomyces sp. JEL0708]
MNEQTLTDVTVAESPNSRRPTPEPLHIDTHLTPMGNSVSPVRPSAETTATTPESQNFPSTIPSTFPRSKLQRRSSEDLYRNVAGDLDMPKESLHRHSTLGRVTKAFAPLVPLQSKRTRPRTISESSSESRSLGAPAAAAEPEKPDIKDRIIRKLSLRRSRSGRSYKSSDQSAGHSRGPSFSSESVESSTAKNGFLTVPTDEHSVPSTPRHSNEATSPTQVQEQAVDAALQAEVAHVIEFSQKRNRELHRLFPELSPSEVHVDDYTCALQKEILIHGRLYLTLKHFCFNANIFGYITNLVLPIEDVVQLEKKTVLLIPNAIQVVTKENKYFFASFVKRDEAYIKMMSLMHATRKLSVGALSSNNLLSADADQGENEHNEVDRDDTRVSSTESGPGAVDKAHFTFGNFQVLLILYALVGWSLIMAVSCGYVLMRLRKLVSGVEYFVEQVERAQ